MWFMNTFVGRSEMNGRMLAAETFVNIGEQVIQNFIPKGPISQFALIGKEYFSSSDL